MQKQKDIERAFETIKKNNDGFSFSEYVLELIINKDCDEIVELLNDYKSKSEAERKLMDLVTIRLCGYSIESIMDMYISRNGLELENPTDPMLKCLKFTILVMGEREENWILPVEIGKDPELEFDKWLAEICFCDSYEILDIKELNDDESLRFLLKMNADLHEPFAQAILAANGWA
jgi:hypothetical protein